MGDRGNIIVKDGDGAVYLYSHWTGSDLPTVLQAALKRAKGVRENDGRLTDAPYLARIIFWTATGRCPTRATYIEEGENVPGDGLMLNRINTRNRRG